MIYSNVAWSCHKNGLIGVIKPGQQRPSNAFRTSLNDTHQSTRNDYCCISNKDYVSTRAVVYGSVYWASFQSSAFVSILYTAAIFCEQYERTCSFVAATTTCTCKLNLHLNIHVVRKSAVKHEKLSSKFQGSQLYSGWSENLQHVVPKYNRRKLASHGTLATSRQPTSGDVTSLNA